MVSGRSSNFVYTSNQAGAVSFNTDRKTKSLQYAQPGMRHVTSSLGQLKYKDRNFVFNSDGGRDRREDGGAGISNTSNSKQTTSTVETADACASADAGQGQTENPRSVSVDAKADGSFGLRFHPTFNKHDASENPPDRKFVPTGLN